MAERDGAGIPAAGGPPPGFLVAGAVLLNLALQFLLLSGTVERPAGVRLALRAYAAPTADDSWRPMTAAIEHLRVAPAEPLYARVFFADSTKFQYPPGSLVLPDLAQRASGIPWPRFWWLADWLARILLPVSGVLGWLLLRRGTALEAGAAGGRASPIGDSRGMSPAGAAAGALALALAAATFSPLARSVQLGQAQSFLTVLAAGALLAWQGGRTALAGGLLGLCCAVKPHWAFLLPWLALRREWRATLAFTAAAFLPFAVSVAMYGFRHWADYASVLVYIAERGEAWYANQSVNGLLNRLLVTGSAHDWQAGAFPAYHPVVHAGTLASSAALLLGALLWRWRSSAGALDLALALLTLAIAAPVAWEHHYGILLFVLCLLVPARRRLGGTGLTPAALLLAYLLAANFQELPRGGPLQEALAQSWLLLTGLIVLAMLYRATARPPGRPV